VLAELVAVKNPNSTKVFSPRALGWFFAISLTLFCPASAGMAQDVNAAKDVIRKQIAKYATALDLADIDLASQVWRTSADISFIHPAGHAHGWNEVKEIYHFFSSSFSERKLTVRDVSVHINGDSAWAEFYWHFVAKTKDGSVIQTDGRETQIYEKTGNSWLLVHVHYSGPAMTR